MSRRILCRVLLVAVFLVLLLAFPGILGAQGHSEEAFERVKQVQERHTERLLAIEGVEGTAVGLDQNDRPVVEVLLERPDVAGIPKKLDGIPVHAIVTGKFYALAKPAGKPNQPVNPAAWFQRPVPIGVSTGHPNITAGTIGCRVKDEAGNVYALSNNHVYADENRADIGDAVLQPGPYDGGGKVLGRNDVIGTLAAFEEIAFFVPPFRPGIDPVNQIDAAIALSSTGSLGKATPSNGYGTPQSVTMAAYIGQPVQKYGRTTGLTKGKVWAVNATVDVTYDSGIARFVNQVIIRPGTFSAGGDSGSLVVVQQKGQHNRKPVGLLFAGSQSMTVANPIDVVLGSLGVTIDGE